jgi:hypothetical protein
MAGARDGVDVEPADHALGRSRGGWTTKLHLGCEQGRKPLSILITAISIWRRSGGGLRWDPSHILES